MLGAFEIPARHSLVVELVGKEDLAQVIGLNSTGFNLARVLGPSVAALVLARLGVSWTFGLNALRSLAMLLGLAMIRLPEQRAGASSFDGMREAIAHVRDSPPLPLLLAIATVFSVLSVPVITLLPVVARDQLGLGADGSRTTPPVRAVIRNRSGEPMRRRRSREGPSSASGAGSPWAHCMTAYGWPGPRVHPAHTGANCEATCLRTC